MKWKDIKIATLQKMNQETDDDEATKEFTVKMWQVANEALDQIALVGKTIIKSASLFIAGEENLLDVGHIVMSHKAIDLILEADKGQSYYFQINGTATIYIEQFVGIWNVLKTVETSSIKFVDLKGNLTNNGLPVRIRFSGSYAYTIRNVAIYEGAYPFDELIPVYSAESKLILRKELPDFYTLIDGIKDYEGKKVNYRFDGSDTLVFNSDVKGEINFHYNAYPQRFTPDTPDDEEILIDPECADIMPLYMSSQLFKDEEIGIATSHRNEFETALGRLSNNQPAGKYEFKNEGGW